VVPQKRRPDASFSAPQKSCEKRRARGSSCQALDVNAGVKWLTKRQSGEFIMPAPRSESHSLLHSRLLAARLVLTGILPAAILLAAGLFLSISAFSGFVEPTEDASAQEPVWAGDLSAPRTVATAEPGLSAKSESYTSGFDPAAVGLVQRKSPEAGKSLPRDAHACVEESTDPAHASSLCIKSTRPVQPQPRPAALKPVAENGQKPSSGFFPQLPTARQLLSPFTFVSDKVASLFKRS
jgi:hypothetical protein